MGILSQIHDLGTSEEDISDQDQVEADNFLLFDYKTASI